MPDPFNQDVVGLSIKPRMTTDIVINSLAMAWFSQEVCARLGQRAHRELLRRFGYTSPSQHLENRISTQHEQEVSP